MGISCVKAAGVLPANDGGRSGLLNRGSLRSVKDAFADGKPAFGTALRYLQRIPPEAK
jgi:hypothetical protein